ncbi:MAG: DnaB-like helicase C-terminal domain-containing protein [Vigna little leaf phytoplasma]|nr:DnaB-like helicase C-terminal domain-containing protein [Vigna little leaf phytoplasma]
MLTPEKQALNQLITYWVEGQSEKLKFYLAIINPQYLDPWHQKIFNAVTYLYHESSPFRERKNRESIIATVLTYCQTHFPQDDFTSDTLAFLNTPSTSNLFFLTHLKYTYAQEGLFQQLMKMIQPSFAPDPYHKHLYYQKIFTKLKEFTYLLPDDQDNTLYTIDQMTTRCPEILGTDASAQQTIQESSYRLSAVFRGLNQATNGFKKGQVITIGGYTGLGKTSFVYNLLLDIAKTKYQESQIYPQMLVFSLEMTLTENLTRLLAQITQIPLGVMLTKDFHQLTPLEYAEKMTTATQFFQQLPLTFSYAPSKRFDYIVDLVYRLHLEEKVNIVVLDHLQIIKNLTHLENDRLAIDEIMTKLKNLAVELNIVIIILSQFSRDTYLQARGKSPEITALKGSGGIETNSDIVLMMSEFQAKLTKEQDKPFDIYNDAFNQLYYRAQEETENQKIIEVNIKKNRSGIRKTLLYHFNQETQTFQEIGYVLPYQITDIK